MRNSTSKIQIRVLVPANATTNQTKEHNQFREWICENFGGFSINPNESIRGAWRNPETGKVEYDHMIVYYIWLDLGSDVDIASDCRSIADKVMAIYGEKAVSIIRDTTVIPMIFS